MYQWEYKIEKICSGRNLRWCFVPCRWAQRHSRQEVFRYSSPAGCKWKRDEKWAFQTCSALTEEFTATAGCDNRSQTSSAHVNCLPTFVLTLLTCLWEQTWKCGLGGWHHEGEMHWGGNADESPWPTLWHSCPGSACGHWHVKCHKDSFSSSFFCSACSLSLMLSQFSAQRILWRCDIDMCAKCAVGAFAQAWAKCNF